MPEIYDDTCLECDSWDIKMTPLPGDHAEYVCNECGFVWTDED